VTTMLVGIGWLDALGAALLGAFGITHQVLTKGRGKRELLPVENLPPEVMELEHELQITWLKAFQAVAEATGDEAEAAAVAWALVRDQQRARRAQKEASEPMDLRKVRVLLKEEPTATIKALRGECDKLLAERGEAPEPPRSKRVQLHEAIARKRTEKGTDYMTALGLIKVEDAELYEAGSLELPS
jgi:hypothetical protein